MLKEHDRPHEAARMIKRPLLAAVVVLSTSALVMSACSAPPPPKESELLAEATQSFEDTSYLTAIEDYERLIEQFPFSDAAETARLRIGHAHYLARQYQQAIAAFNDFERLHPTSPDLPFVEYTIGLCYLDQSTTHDRDKSASEDALRQFERVAQRHAGTLYGELARFRALQARENLAEHELAVAAYYMESGNSDAAYARYQYVLSAFPSTESAQFAAKKLAKRQPVDDAD